MMLLNSQADVLSYQLRALLADSGINFSFKQIQRFLIISYQQCFKRLQRAALSEGLIDKKLCCQSITSYLEQLKNYWQQKWMPDSKSETILKDTIKNIRIVYV